MELIPQELKERLPGLYAQEKSADPMVACKLVAPWLGKTWLVLEGFLQDGIYFVYARVFGEDDQHYFALSTIEDLRGPGGEVVELEKAFTPRPLSQALAELRN